MSHAGFLRDHWDDAEHDCFALVRALHALGHRLAALPPGEVPEALDREVPSLPASAPDRALLRFVLQLALAPRTHDRGAVQALRAAGHDDRAVHDIVHVVACFSYMNRLADGVGVVVLPARYALAEELFGAEQLERHLAWGAP